MFYKPLQFRQFQFLILNNPSTSFNTVQIKCPNIMMLRCFKLMAVELSYLSFIFVYEFLVQVFLLRF